jgi:hypothetical protein
MKSDKSHHNKPRREFGGCVEFIPQPPKLIEFIDSRRIWGFPIQQLTYFALQEIPEHRDKPILPPDRLVLVYEPVIVVLRGWRLELMVEPLVNGRIARVHAEKHPGTLPVEEAWVSEIRIFPQVNHDLLKPEAQK